MPAKDGGYFSRLVRKLTSDVEELDADEMSMRSGAEGAQRACDCRSGEA
ncbi:DNA-binding protein, partial [Amycolatopsis sp. NPDC058278]